MEHSKIINLLNHSDDPDNGYLAFPRGRLRAPPREAGSSDGESL
jgi:hypothetical protein